MAHAGTENGNLIITYADFKKYGIRRGSLKCAISARVRTDLVTRARVEPPECGYRALPRRGRPHSHHERPGAPLGRETDCVR
jgi:hypothetical protein